MAPFNDLSSWSSVADNSSKGNNCNLEYPVNWGFLLCPEKLIFKVKFYNLKNSWAIMTSSLIESGQSLDYKWAWTILSKWSGACCSIPCIKSSHISKLESARQSYSQNLIS